MTDTARPADAPALPAVVRDDDRPAFLTRATPLIDTLPDRWIAYLASNVAQQDEGAPITKGELGVFVELCAAYSLDPFAREAWIAKSKSGKLLVMVGRDGLRKIAQRNGLHVDGDVVREKDSLQIVRTPDGNRTVAHSYGSPSERGEIVGAWAEVREGSPHGRPMGYFYAPLSEYRPANVSTYSPWAKQVGVMILAAAERQAIRQATPLGGLYSEGEFDSMTTDLTAGVPSSDPVVLPPAVEAIVKRAEQLGHAGLASRDAAAMATGGQPDEAVKAWCERATADLDAYAPGAVRRRIDDMLMEDADVVEPQKGDLPPEPADTPEPTPDPHDAPQEPQDAAQASESGVWPLADRIQSCRDDIARAEDDGDHESFARLSAELSALIAEQDAQANPDQTELGV